MINVLSPWFTAIRPLTLTASMGPVILGISLAYAQTKTINLPIATLTIICAILLQISTNLVNDFLDFKSGIDSQNRLGPKRATQSGLLSEAQIKRGIYLVFFLAVVLGIPLMASGGITIVLIGILSLIFAYLYTGGPLPLSHYCMGELLAFIFFGPIAVFGTWFLQTNQFSFYPVLIGIGPGLISAALLSVNNLRDRKSDKLANKTTLAVILNENFARLLPVLLSLSSVVLLLLIPLKNHFLIVGITLISLFLFGKTWWQILKKPIDRDLNRALAKTGQFLFLYCLILSMGLLL